MPVVAIGVPNHRELEPDSGDLAPVREPSRGKIEVMEKTARHFDSFKASELADIEGDLAMSPEERIAIVLELRARVYPDAAQQGFARVYRITNRQRG
jgi:hypothetical protein